MKIKVMKYRLKRYWDVVRYDLPRFFKNIWRFRKGLWQFRHYDPHGVYVLNHIALIEMANHVEKYGYEVDETRLKKVAKMRRAAELYKNHMEDNFIEQAEAELGALFIHPFELKPSEDHPEYFTLVDKDTPEEKAHNRKVFDRARDIEKEQWNELYAILKGLDYSKFNSKTDKWYDWYDGSDLRAWWD